VLVFAVKSVSQKHQASLELMWLLDEFRRMVNVCIAVGIEENVSSLKTLSMKSGSVPTGLQVKPMIEEREPENATLILKVDGGKLSQQPTTTGINPTKT
jgi:hypothetical protein